MWRVARNSLPYFALVCSACSLVVDFPEKVPVAEQRDAGPDARPLPDGEVIDARPQDAVADAIDPTADSGPISCTASSGCESDQLCCPAAGGGSACRPLSPQSCTECGVPCSDPRAPNCGAKVCECVAGSGRACPDDQLCLGAGAEARCVQCETDVDCGAVSGRGQCVNNQCVQCDRGAMPNSAEDDEGCSGATPICGPDNLCVGCNNADPATQCPNGLECNPGRGCAGCALPPTPVGANKCMGTTPVCKPGPEGPAECDGCANNLDCMFLSGPGYCVETTGACSNRCDPDATVGGNGCDAATGRPFCKAADVEGGFDCAPCADSDCNTPGSVTPFCATTGVSAGRCVQCRMSEDCNQNSLTPVCGVNGQCRARTMADCAAPTPHLSPSMMCVECTNNTHCDGNPNGRVCDSGTGTCVACNNNSDCPSATPTCDLTSHQCQLGCTTATCTAHPGAPVCLSGACVRCAMSADCPDATPICSTEFTCVSCTQLPGPPAVGDAACALRSAGYRCVRNATAMYAEGQCAPP